MSYYDEHANTNSNSSSGIQLAETEKLLLSMPHLNTKIIVLGLFGAGRHPARFLSNKLLKPNSPINLIHWKIV